MSPAPSSSGAETRGSASGNSASRGENDMIGSLGEALAGVNLGASTVHHTNGFSFHSEHDSGTPFNLASQSNNGGWGFNSDASTQAFNRGTSGNVEEINTVVTEPSTPAVSRVRNDGIDLFLSQSPSQMLGNDVFKLSTNNLPGLEISQNDRTIDPFRQQSILQHGGKINASPVYGDIRSNQEARRKPESPSDLPGTSASSRSGSPYHSVDGGRTIHAYNTYENANNTSSDASSKRNASFAEEDRSSYVMAPGLGLQHQMGIMDHSLGVSAGYNMNNMAGAQNYSTFGSPYDSVGMLSSPQKPAMGIPGQQQSQPQQVLYMAVPTPDGRGQVLQPVQMVQLPGKPFAYVLPGQAGATPAMPAAMQSAMPGMEPQQQPIMVLPNMPVQQQPPHHDDLAHSLVGINGRHSIQDRGSGYRPNPPESTQHSEALGSAHRGESYSSSVPGSPFSPGGPEDPLSSLYNNPQRPPLDALLGQVRRLSRDQVGCRLVQQALEEEGPMAATLILNEGLSFWGEAMVDPFGNYLFQKILEKITPEERIILVKSVGPRLVNASLNLHGTRSVQKIVELCAIDDENGEPREKKDGESASDILTRSLAPAAARLCIDSHGNHVIQRILLKLGHNHSRFVFDAVAESVGDVARHRHGCCVIQRCLDSPPCPARSHLVRRIVDKSLELMQDAYGNYVVQYVLDVCSDEDVHAVCESVVGKINLLAIQKFSSNVMEKCLERCTDRVKEHYMNELCDTERIRELMMDPFGNYVVQRALSVATHAQAVRLVEAMRPHLTATQPGTPNGHRNGGVRNTAGGRRIMAKICRRFPNFNLNGVGTQDDIYSQNKGHHRHQQHSSPVGPTYGQLAQPGQLHMQQHHHPHPHPHHQPYNVNPHAVNLNVHHQYDQRQPYFDLAEAGYFHQAPHMGSMGNGAYQNGF